MRGIKPKKLLMIVLVLAILGVAGWFGMRSNHARQETENQNLCTEDPVGKALSKDVSVLQKSNLNKLKPIASEITALKNYEKSPTCLYVLTMYYINSADAVKAEVEYVKLKEVLKPGVSYGKNIQKAAASLKDLQILIEGVKLRTEQYKKNTLYGPAVVK